MDKWQPIYTAPLDSGEPHYFLVYTNHENTMIACGMDGKLILKEGTSFDVSYYGDPTHWMPLPKPPVKYRGEL